MKKLILFGLFLLCFRSQAQLIPVKHFDFEGSAIEDLAITCVYEDEDGFLWLAVYGKGLVRFDGKNIEPLFESAFTNNGKNFALKIRDIYQDEYGYLWLICDDNDKETNQILVVSNRPVGQDLISDSLSFIRTHFDVPLLGKGINLYGSRFSISPQGKIMVHTAFLILEYYYTSPSTFTVDTILAIEVNENETRIRSAIYLSDGNIAYISSGANYVTCSKDSHGATKFDTLPMGIFENFQIFNSDANGGAWAGSSESCIHIPAIKNFRSEPIRLIPKAGPIEAMEYLDENTLLIASKGSGVSELDVNSYELLNNYSDNNGLLNRGVFWLQKGKNNIWIGSLGGAERLQLNYRAFNAYTSDYEINGQPFLPNNGVNAVLSNIKLENDVRDFTAAATTAGVVLFDKDGSHQLIDESHGLNSSVIVGIQKDSKNRIWISSVRSGINCVYPKGKSMKAFKNKRPIKLFDKDYEVAFMPGLTMFNPYLFRMSNNNLEEEEVLYAANSTSLNIVVENEKWLAIPRVDAFPFVTVESGFTSDRGLYLLAQDSDHYIYVANKLGLKRTLKPMTRSYYEELKENGIETSGAVVANQKVLEDVPLTWNGSEYYNVNNMIIHENELWVSVDEGIVVLSVPSFESIAFIELPASPASFAYHKGQIWAGTTDGMMAFDIAAHRLVKHLKAEDGLLNETNWGPQTLSSSSDDLLYFGTAQGLVEYNAMYDYVDTPAISVAVRDYVYTESNWGKNELNLSYIGLTYDEPEQMKYKTMLVGNDDQWSEITNDTKIRYTNLTAYLFPKTYEFNIQATDHSDQWFSAASTFPIKVRPAIWSRWWSFLLYGVLIYLAIRKYTRWQLAEQKKKLALSEAKVLKEKNQVIEKKNSENELLLKEIHHRVKNNLQTISSLLSLQSRFIKDKAALGAVQESKSRVESMALIHQKLYQGENLAAIEMKDYFENIAKSVKNSFGQIAENVQFEIDMDPLEMDVDTAVPIGLITNELITNSFKHAFGKGDRGEIKINLSKNIDSSLELTISDNGVGANVEGKENQKGFGSMLIKMLAAQLEGTLEESTVGGRSVTLKFKEQLSVA